MIAYASRTGTKRNLAALRDAGWRLMISPRGQTSATDFPYALDNGAWTAFQEFERGERAENFLDLEAFERTIKTLGPGADWIALPDVVMGGQASLDLSLAWRRKLRRRPAFRRVVLMIVVQNGMEAGPMLARIKRIVGPRCGIFVGGDTDWKLGTMAQWSALARRRGAICHIGRVNTVRRIRLCEIAGAHSFDGSSASRFAINIPKLDAARRQPDMFTPRRPA